MMKSADLIPSIPSGSWLDDKYGVLPIAGLTGRHQFMLHLRNLLRPECGSCCQAIAGAWSVWPVVMRFHAIRAILLVEAIKANLGGFLLSKLTAPWLSPGTSLQA
jgi:hypothetical protein